MFKLNEMAGHVGNKLIFQKLENKRDYSQYNF
jgi:hypothetical protein